MTEDFWGIGSDVLFLQAAEAHTTVHTLTENFPVSGPLSKHAAALPPQLQRIRKSYLGNTRQVATIRRFRPVLKDGRELPISKERYGDLKRFLQG